MFLVVVVVYKIAQVRNFLGVCLLFFPPPFFPNVVFLLGMFKNGDIGMGQYKISLH